ncbi:putative two-component system sensor kinase [Serinicoccus hydrothermalis]|uniref:histidine kinase n=1 Tax=Serinicoccus hydrothermalis TaxID=1758689 RepID=A0A1B1NCM7_9MICO|nr:sensor histidine kinase [Serinicoccus hydrothermalis]ANS79176.1 putative two-component system sensor kinase [Serinicoccus hydrothermalis]
MSGETARADGPRDLEPVAMARLVRDPTGPVGPPVEDPLPQTSPPASVPVRLQDGLLGWLADAWWTVCYVVTGLFTAVVALTLAGVAVGGVTALLGLGAGVLILVPAIWGSFLLSRVERHRIAAFLGVDIGERPPSTAPTWRRVLGLDEVRLRALGWAGLHGLWGLISGALGLALLVNGVLLATSPLWAWVGDGVSVLGLFRVGSTLGMTVAWLIGVAVVLGMPWIARGLASVDVVLARWLIGEDAQAQLRRMSERVDTLTTTREDTLDSVEAERRRIERDLHDGPQQRLVSIAMSLGLARDALDRDPDDPEAARRVRQLLDEAHSSSKEAITEMRQVARGIVPPILTDRGLDAAVSALAARSPVPVTVTDRLPPGRLDPTIEAIAYFSVSEALTNIAKHARAGRAGVELGTARGLTGDLLAVTVTDDGQGGAVIGGGSGLTGLRQRVGAVDGQLHVHSPVGSGTTVAITLPLRERTTR